jgi:hypothetical protein
LSALGLNVANMTQKQIYQEFCTVVEERILDEVCAFYKMGWDAFIEKVRGGWNPDVGSNGCTWTAPNEHLLDCYREARKELGT